MPVTSDGDPGGTSSEVVARVLDAQGQPVAGATVSLKSIVITGRGDSCIAQSERLTDTQGECRFTTDGAQTYVIDCRHGPQAAMASTVSGEAAGNGSLKDETPPPPHRTKVYNSPVPRGAKPADCPACKPKQAVTLQFLFTFITHHSHSIATYSVYFAVTPGHSVHFHHQLRSVFCVRPIYFSN
jgi:hypothetical protein